jgi:hypothetical protein
MVPFFQYLYLPRLLVKKEINISDNSISKYSKKYSCLERMNCGCGGGRFQSPVAEKEQA